MTDSQASPPAAPAPAAATRRARGRWLINLVLQDLFSNRRHSRDFNGSRADYIVVRIRVLAVTLAIITPLWIPLDFLLLPAARALDMGIMRGIATVVFAGLALSVRPRYHLPVAYLKFTVLIGALGFCYVRSQLIVDGAALQGLLVAYGFLPYLLIAVQAIFPLTLLESLLFIALSMVLVAGVEAYSGRLFTLDVLAELWLMGLLAGITIWAQMTQLHMLLSLYRQATHDPLTGLYNRRVFMDRLDDEIRRARRYLHPISVLLFDLDRFKRINDTYGHLTGDKVLQSFAALLTRTLRTTDLISRYGGEEFLVLLPETEAQAGLELAERIRRDYEAAILHGTNREVIHATVSGGVAQLGGDETPDELIKRVDEHLYQAKKSGRNQVICST